MEILPTHLREGTISKEAIKLWDIWAATFEEASAIQNLRPGFGPYRPVGEPKLCPNGCGCHYYPLGSGDCAICGNIE